MSQINQKILTFGDVDRNPPINTSTNTSNAPDPAMNTSWERSRIKMDVNTSNKY